MQREYRRQREYLENTVASLKHKMVQDADMHRTEKRRLMRENIALTKEFSTLQVRGVERERGGEGGEEDEGGRRTTEKERRGDEVEWEGRRGGGVGEWSGRRWSGVE